MNKCPNCQQIYSDDVFYCLSDGTYLVGAATDVPTLVIPSPVVTRPDSTTLRNSNAGILIAIGLAVVVGGATIWWMSSGNDSRLPVNEPASNQGAKNAEGASDELAAQKESLRIDQQRFELEKQRLQLNKSSQPPASIPSAANTAGPPRVASPAAGTWFVILGTYGRNETEKANQRLSYVQSRGISASIISTDQYPGLRSGLISVVVGPFSKSGAKGSLAGMKSAVPDAYVKSGW